MENLTQGKQSDPDTWSLVPMENAHEEVATPSESSIEASPTEHVESPAVHSEAVAQQQEAEAAKVALMKQEALEAYKSAAAVSAPVTMPAPHAVENIDTARAAVGRTNLEAPHIEGSPYNQVELGTKLAREVSGGAIKRVRNEGFVIDEKALANHGEKLRVDLERAEAAESRAALNYVTSLPKGTLEAYHHPVHPSLNNPRDFEIALEAKSRDNKQKAKKVFLGLGGTASLSFGGVFAAGAVGSTALASGLLLASGGLGVAAIAAYGGKRLYDRYRERRAIKEFSAATIAKRVRGSLFG